MTVDTYLDTQSHEGDLHLIYREDGLQPYYAMDSIRKEWDEWQTEGKPTATVEWEGQEWALCYDYDDSALDPWEHESYQLESVPEFRFYCVAKDELWDEERADMSKRVTGGTITVRPRWPDLTANGGEPVQGVPNLGAPYIDVQLQMSNVDHSQYQEFAQTVMDAFGISRSYFRDPHEMSNWHDAAVYVRVDRDASGPVHAPSGPLSRIHQLLEGDREGYREHTDDNREIPGYYVGTKITDERARELIKGHRLGKEAKHYYPNHPKHFSENHPLYHPKVEVAYQTNLTDETVYWDRDDAMDTEDMLRELETTLLNILDWSGLPVATGGSDSPYIPDVHFSAQEGNRRTRKLVDCPLPEIEDQQEAAVMQLWGGIRDSSADVIGHLLTDGGKDSPKKVADETGYSYRTVREVVNRCEDVIDHAYGELQIASKHQQEMLKDRVNAAEENFRSAVEDAAMTAADALEDTRRSAWAKVRQRYNVTVDPDPSDCRKKLKVGYKPKTRHEARNIVQELKNAYEKTHDDRGGAAGVHAVVTMEDHTRKTYESLETQTVPPKAHSEEARQHREAVESIDWEAHGYPDVTGG